MVNLKYKTRGNIDPQGKAKVYFCCHSDDFDRFFESISNEILEKNNCAIWYAEPDAVRDEEFLDELKYMHLFVMPISTKLLSTENVALDIEFSFAIKNHIPVLPLMQETGLEELFNKKCGELQFLNKYEKDSTAIGYEEKLEKYLYSVLVDDELATKIRAAFDAYVFLSYRKIDRKYARELMKLVHKNDFCRDVAIWYDEFLTPGENFNDSIKKALLKSELFLLAVTPNLIKDTNYIMTEEYPTAIQEGKVILPVELVATDRKKLYECYKDIPEPIDAYDASLLADGIMNSIKNIALRENDSSAEHNFFIGLAYLTGIDVEVDEARALSLINIAAEAGLYQAMEKLADMYRNGISVEKNPETAIYWYNRLINAKKETFDITHSAKDALELYNTYFDLGILYEQLHKYAESYEAFIKLEKVYEEIKCEDENKTVILKIKATIFMQLGITAKCLGNGDISFDNYNKAYEVLLELSKCSEEDYICMKLTECYLRMAEFLEEQFNYANAKQVYIEADKTLKKVKNKNSYNYRQNLSRIYMRMGNVDFETQNFSDALENYKKFCELAEQLFAEKDEAYNKINVTIAHNKIGHVLLKLKEEQAATDEYLKSYKMLMGEDGIPQNLDIQRQLMITLSHLANANVICGNYEFAKELYLDAIDISKRLVNKFGTIQSYQDLVESCDNLVTFYIETDEIAEATKLSLVWIEASKKVLDYTNSHKDIIRLTRAYMTLGDILSKQEKYEMALSQYKNACELRKKYFEKNLTESALVSIQYSLIRIGETCIKLNRIDEAGNCFNEAVEICEKVANETKTTHHFDLLATAYMKLASVTSGEEQYELISLSADIHDILCEDDPNNERFKRDRDILREWLAENTTPKSKTGGFFKKIFKKY